MKGIIFRELEKMVVSQLGEDAWDELITTAPLSTTGGAFVAAKVYPDSDLLALVTAATRVTGRTVPELVRVFGKFIFPDLVALHPEFVKPGMSAKAFLMTVDEVIHVEVRKLHPDTILPKFSFEDPGPDRLVMLYSSARGLCDLVSGLIDGVGAYFKERIAHDHTTCKQRGEAACRFDLKFEAVE
jgi:Haem-NO-binding